MTSIYGSDYPQPYFIDATVGSVYRCLF